jgi:Domain of unknown function (DUF4157)
MSTGRDHKQSGGSASEAGGGASSPEIPGKTSLVHSTFGVQRRASATGQADAGQADADVHAAAAHGISGGAEPLPHLDRVQRAFGTHDVSGIQAHTGAAASAGSRAMGAEGFAAGDHVAFDGAPSLHTAAHEAAHVVQQRAGVHLKGGVGTAGDAYERHADAVADRVVAGDSAQDLLDQHAPGGSDRSTGGVQRAVQRQVPPPAANPPTANPGGGPGATPGPGPLDPLRTAVQGGDAGAVRAAYTALPAADKVALAHDTALLTQIVRLLDPSVALSILTELALPRPTLLQVAAGGKPGDATFLAEVLALAGLNNLTALAASAGELRPFPAFLTRAVIDPIVNASSATAMGQLQLASTPGGQALLQAVYPGQIPIELLTKLAADLATARGGFQTTPAFRQWMLTKPDVLGLTITRTSDGFAWARALWSSPDAGALVPWITAYTAYWGGQLGDGLLASGNAADGVALRGNPAVATAVLGAVARIHAAAGLVLVLAKLNFTPREQIRALHGAGVLDAASLQQVLNAAGVTAAGQASVARDNEVIAMIQPLVAGQRADQVFTVLAADPAAFIHTATERNSFATWVTHDQAQLTATMNALPNWSAWIDCFRTLNAWELLLRLAGDATLKANLRAGLIARAAWSWLVMAVPHPVATQPQASALLDLFGDGSGIALADKYLTWTALYRTPLSRAGHDHVYSWTGGFLNTTKWEKRYFAVDPDDTAMNFFFHSFRQLPRAHIDTAAGVMMNNVYHIKSNPLIGSNKFWNDSNNPWTQMGAPGQIPNTTSWYMNDNWIIMRATSTAGAVGSAGSVGTPDTGRIGNWSGSGMAVNTPGTDPLSPATPANMTMFQNHATHEVGHAVGARTLHHGAYNVAGDDWTRTYGAWAQNGNANGYATMCGWTAAMDGTNYTIGGIGGPSVTLAGAQIKAFLTGIIAGGKPSQTSHTLATTFSGVDPALTALSGHVALGANLLVQNVFQLRFQGNIPDMSYVIPAGIDPGATKVHFFATRWGNQWVTYDALCWRNKVSHYGVSSYKEMFAEMYVAKFSSAALSPPNNGMNPTDFFNALAAADPTELGLPAYGGAATPAQPSTAPGAGDSQVAGAGGAGAGGAGAGGAGAGGAQQPPPPPQGHDHNPADDMPASARGTPL